MKGFSSYPKLNWVAIAFTCIVFFLNSLASRAQTSEDLPYGYKAIWFDSSSGCKGNEDAPDKFMSESNASIIANVKELDCNTIFLNVSLLKINPFQTANSCTLEQSWERKVLVTSEKGIAPKPTKILPDSF